MIGLGELTVYVDEDRRGVDVHVGTSPVFVQMVALSMRKANGRLHLHLLRTLVYCNGTALSVFSRGVVDRVFRDVIERCPAPQNPGGPYLVMAPLISFKHLVRQDAPDIVKVDGFDFAGRKVSLLNNTAHPP